jgi:hypothetical protein
VILLCPPKAASAGTDCLPIDSTKNSEMTNAEEPEAQAEHLEDIADAGDKTRGDSQEATSAARPCSGSVTLLSLNMDSQSRCEIRKMRLERSMERQRRSTITFSTAGLTTEDQKAMTEEHCWSWRGKQENEHRLPTPVVMDIL